MRQGTAAHSADHAHSGAGPFWSISTGRCGRRCRWLSVCMLQHDSVCQRRAGSGYSSSEWLSCPGTSGSIWPNLGALVLDLVLVYWIAWPREADHGYPSQRRHDDSRDRQSHRSHCPVQRVNAADSTARGSSVWGCNRAFSPSCGEFDQSARRA